MLCSSLAWRRHHNVDKILTDWRPPEAVLEYYSGGWHHYDKGETKPRVIESTFLEVYRTATTTLSADKPLANVNYYVFEITYAS